MRWSRSARIQQESCRMPDIATISPPGFFVQVRVYSANGENKIQKTLPPRGHLLRLTLADRGIVLVETTDKGLFG